MAYLVDLSVRKCLGCGRHATQKLCNMRNETLGLYCKRCGKRALEAIQKSEAASR